MAAEQEDERGVARGWDRLELPLVSCLASSSRSGEGMWGSGYRF